MTEHTDPTCPLCSAPEPRLRYRITRFRVLECVACDLVYLWPRLSPEEVREMFSQLYTEGEGSVPELKTYYEFCYEDEPDNPLVQQYEGWLDAMERYRKPGRLLDVGCGTGLFLSVARRRGWEPHGIDENVEATDHARDHFGLDVHVGEFSKLPDDEGIFDAITGWDIIEHARSPLALLRAARSRLAPDGIVAMSTPNQRSSLDVVAGAISTLTGGRVTWPLEKFYIEQHFIYFSPETLRETFERADLDVVELRQEQTDLRRLTLTPAMRLVLELLFLLGRLTGRQNRLFSIARQAPGRAA